MTPRLPPRTSEPARFPTPASPLGRDTLLMDPAHERDTAPDGLTRRLHEGPHIPSHLHLLSPVPRYDPGPAVARLELSGIVVPTRRPMDQSAPGLALAAHCAEVMDAQLVVLRSGPASRVRFPRTLAPSTSAPALVIDLPDRFTPAFTGGGTDQHVVGELRRSNDVATKRNLGLVLGLLCGWQAALFLDDDISTTRASRLPPAPADDVHPLLRLDDVLADFAAYPDLHVAGFLQKDFDDNSVICHARRITGLPQGGFISGGAAVVRCGSHLPFFPATYNEDWLFFFALMINGRHMLPSSAVKLVGPVHQSPYYPFSVTRARSEELGDVLAEGIFGLMTRPRSEVLALACSTEYWGHVVRRRQDMILDVLQRLGADHCDLPGVGADAREALLAALAVYSSPTRPWGEELAQYVHAFFEDLDRWHELLARLAPAAGHDALDLADAVDLLGLADGAAWSPGRPVHVGTAHVGTAHAGTGLAGPSGRACTPRVRPAAS